MCAVHWLKKLSVARSAIPCEKWSEKRSCRRMQSPVIRVWRDNGNHKKNDLFNIIFGKLLETPTRAAQSRSLALIIKKYVFVWHECFKSVSKVLQKCFKVCQEGVKSVWKRYTSVTKALQKRYTSVTKALQKFFRAFRMRFKRVSKCFAGVVLRSQHMLYTIRCSGTSIFWYPSAAKCMFFIVGNCGATL